MSVPENERTVGRLDVNTKALNLCVYTLRITANPKVFIQDQDAFTQKIRDVATDIHLLCWEANNVNVCKSMERYKTRIELQARAIDKCNSLCALIEIAKPLYHLATRRVVFWTDRTVKLREMIINWKNSDIKRLKPTEV